MTELNPIYLKRFARGSKKLNRLIDKIMAPNTADNLRREGVYDLRDGIEDYNSRIAYFTKDVLPIHCNEQSEEWQQGSEGRLFEEWIAVIAAHRIGEINLEAFLDNPMLARGVNRPRPLPTLDSVRAWKNDI